MEFDLDALPEIDGQPKIDSLPDLDALPEVGDDTNDLASLPELDADGKPVEEQKKSLGIFGTLGAQTDLKAGRKTGTLESIAENTPVVGQVMDAEYNRQWNNLQRLYEGDFNDAIEATRLAQSLGFSEDDLRRINEEAGYGGKNLLGNYTKFDLEKGKALFKELVGPEFTKRLQAREAAQQQLTENDLNWVQKGVVGGVGATKLLGSMANAPLAAATLGIDATNRAAEQLAGKWILDENGQPTKIWWKTDANGEPVRDEAGNLVPREELSQDMAMLKGFAGAATERFIWMGLGKVASLGFGKAAGALEKTAAGAKVSEVLAKATSGTMKGVQEATEWLGKTSAGRAVLNVGKAIGWLNSKGKFGSIPDMMVKSRIQEFADQVVGLSVADPAEREEFTQWLGKFVSVKENAELFTEMLAMHLAMKAGGTSLNFAGRGLEKIGLKEAREFDRKSAIGRRVEETVAELVGEERAAKLTDKDLVNLYRIVTSDGFTAERAEQFAEKVAGDVDEAQKLIDEGASLSSLAEGLKARRQYSDQFVEGAKAAAAELRDRVTLDGAQSAKINDAALKAAEGNVEIAAKVAALAKAQLTNKHTQVDDADGLDSLVANAMRPFAPEARAVKIHDMRGNRNVGEQLKALEELGIATVEDAELNGVVRRDENGRLTGGARQAVNIAAHGTDALRSAVKDGSIDAATAEALITTAHTELGTEAPEARKAFIDGILERAKGDAALARRMAENEATEFGTFLASWRTGNEAEIKEELDGAADLARTELKLESEKGATSEISNLKLSSIEGGMLGCSRFRSMSAQFGESTDEAGNVRKELSVKGLGEGQLAKPGNWADGAVLVAELARIAEKNDAELVFDRAETAIEANGLLAKVKSEGLTRAKAKLETRAKLVDILARSALDTGVTFDEASFRKALEETPNGSKYRDNHGNIYGLTSPDGTLHFNPTQLDYNIPIHEYGHLALESMKGVNRRLWERGMELVKDSDYYRSIKEQSETEGHEYGYLKGNDAGICDEALAHLIGDNGEKLIEAQGVGAELKAWLQNFWKAFKGAFGLADLGEAQIEKMTLGEFVDAVNAELLRGKDFGTRKEVPLEKKSIKRYDEAEESGSNGLLRWKNDRGRLFNIPVDMERTQPGGKVVFAPDDVNITDWIADQLDGYTLRMSKKGKVYVEGRDGFDGRLAEIFGRYPTIGKNDGIFETMAEELQNERLRDLTPDKLVDMLAKDRANYDRWVKATRDGKTSLEDTRMEEYYSEQAAREEAEARQRWEDSGMDAPEYILSRIEEGEPGFDLDRETMRELAHEEAEGRFAVGRIFTGTAADYANRSREGGKDDGPSLLKIGTGEGAQVYGWGLYGSTVRGVAEGYAKDAREYNAEKNGKRIDLIFPKNMLEAETAKRLMENGGDVRKTIEKLKSKGIGSAIIKELEEHGAEYSVAPKHEHLYEQTFFTNRAPGDESHLLKWYEPVTEREKKLLDELGIVANTSTSGSFAGATTYLKGDHVVGMSLENQGDFYNIVAEALGSPKAASEFLARAGIDGVKYPVDSYGGKGVKDGDKVGWNYVSFRDDNIRVDHKWTDGAAKFAAGRAVGPSALGDGKQRYYEVPFDKAVDKIVKNKKPIGNEQVFVSETPKVFADIGFARLPIMMTQKHVLTISSDAAALKSLKIGGNAHDMKAVLKQVPKAIQKPLMVIASETRPDSSVVAITQLKDRDGKTVIVPIALDGISPIGNGGLIDSHIITSTYGKGNVWSKLVEDAIAKETNGEVGVFYIDTARANVVRNQLARAASGNSALQWLQLPRGRQNPDFVHSIADEGSPVKGGIVSQTATRQFKNWFGGSKIVDANGEPLKVYRGAEYDPLAQEPGKGVIKPEAYFTADPEYAKRYAGSEGKVRAYYLNIRHPFDIRDPECQKDFESVYPGVKLARGKSGALDWAEAATVDGEFLKENFGDKYDGIIFDEASDWAPEGNLPKWRGISYVPLDGSAQVKSATNNIGTFDPGNPDVRFAVGGGTADSGWIVHGNRLVRRGTPQAAMIGRARVADDAGRGEQTPGTLAASRELSEQPRSRIQELGRVRVTSFPISEIFRMHKELTGNPMPVHVSKRVRGGKVSASSKDGQIYIASDVIGLVDRTDIPPLKEKLGKHGFFRNENEAWAKNHSDFEVRQERERSEAQLGDELRKLADRRASGKELGGQSAERLVYMNEFAKYVMNMPRKSGSLVGDVQTVGDAVRGALNAQLAASGDKRAAQEKKMRDEAKSLLTWSGWRVEDATEADIKNLTDTMFGAWLAIPDEMERLAPTWYDAILETVTTTPSATKAYRAAADRVYNSPQAYKYVLEEIQKSQSAAVKAMRDKLDAEAKAKITARNPLRRFAEGLVLGYHDRMGLTWMRFDEETKMKLRARRAALAELKRKGATKAELKAAAEEIDLFTGRIHQTAKKLELSRSAMERGIQNESLRYVIQQRLLEDKATKKWGLSEADKSLYLDQLWVVDSQGRSGIRGESARQARLILGDMARRLGAEKWARLEEYGREWFSIRERELLNDPRLERLVGKDVVAYWRGNAHYVTTKRVQSQEEMDAIEKTREKMRKAGVNGGDDVCGEMFNYIGDRGGREMLGEKLWKGRLGGSFADKAEVRSATTEKDMKILQAARVNQYAIDLRDALLMAEVPGVRDMPYGKADVKPGSRYGFINYFDYGEKRTLIVPREMADGFKSNPDTFKWTAQMHRVARAAMIDYNLGYLPVNQMRNAGSIEKNMPGVYESWAKTLTRFTGIPGAAPLVDLFLEHAARKSAKADRVLDKVFFGITRFGHINPAERAAKFIFDPEGWQKKFWDAEARGDEDVMRGLLEDKDFAMSALRGNMFTTLGGAYGDAVRDEGLLKIGRKIGEAIDKTPVARQVKKGADWLPRQNEFEDVFAKLVAFHHDRATWGKSHNRTVEESGLVVKQNVSIAEGERKGQNTKAMQTFFGQFFNMREKGVVRNIKAHFDRTKEMLVKDGMVWSGRFVGTMFATGAIAAFIRWLYGDDEKKAESSSLGEVYRFAKFMQAASQNINDYARKQHQLVPVWLSPDGFTTITLGARLNDEDSLIAPSADFVARHISARMGLNPPPELGQTVLDTVWRGVAPDLDPSTPVVKTLRDTLYALAENPIDDFTGKPVYNPVLYAVRNESWATRVDFATEMAKRVWDDWGMSAIWKFDRYGKESSDYGSASKWLGLALNKIPVVSSASRRFVKIHVREPGKGSGVDAAISAEDSRRAKVREYLANKLMKESEKLGGELNRLDPGQYRELLEGWQDTYGLSDYDMRQLEKRFLNNWSERENREWLRNKKRKQLLKKAQRIGIEESERRMIRGEW